MRRYRINNFLERNEFLYNIKISPLIFNKTIRRKKMKEILGHLQPLRVIARQVEKSELSARDAAHLLNA